jgi:sugar O-acyltransferase (sialic acid O-acetyltransferase NeuD family)
MRPVVIVGYGGFGREVYWLAKDCGREVKGFLDDTVPAGVHGRYRVLGSTQDAAEHSEADFVVAVGSPRVRKAVVTKLERTAHPQFATLVHPSVLMDFSSVTIGEGSLICAGCVGTVDFTVGKHVIVNLKCTLAHDDVIGDFVTIAPLVAISGAVILRTGVEVGTGASIRQGVVMEEGSMLGMGSTLTSSTDPNTIFLGSPAKAFKGLPEF